MCGRFTLTASSSQVCEAFGLDRIDEYRPSFNIAPSQAILNITQLPGESLQASYTLYCHWNPVKHGLINHLSD